MQNSYVIVRSSGYVLTYLYRSRTTAMLFAHIQHQYVRSDDRTCDHIISGASSSTAAKKSYGRQDGRPVILGRILNADHSVLAV